MYQAGETVIYGTTGVCIVEEITTRIFDGQSVKYYVLKPVIGQDSTVFVPTENERLTRNIRPILSKEELTAFIHSFPTISPLWTENEEARKELFKEALGSSSREELLGMLKGVWAHGQSLRARGKKLHIADERFVHDAEKVLYAEIAYTFGMDRSDVPSYLESVLHQSEETVATL